MPASTNFLVFNPGCSNQETDSAYSADALRSGGITFEAILTSLLLNKILYQSSIGVTGLMEAMVNKGYSPNDGNGSPSTALANLTSVMQNIMTRADMGPYALLNSPAFTGTPTAPTAAATDDSTKLATTAFVKEGGSYSLGSNGFVKFPASLFGFSFVVQWQYLINTTGGTFSFPTPFPTAALFVIGADGTSASSGACGCSVVSASQFSIKVSTQTNFAVLSLGY